MIYIISYFLISYIFIWAAFTTLYDFIWKYIKHINFIKPYQKQLIVGIILILPFIPYFWVEGQTLMYRSTLFLPSQKAIRDVGMKNERILTLKVLWASNSKAKVYVISKKWLPADSFLCDSDSKCSCILGTIVFLDRTHDKWEFTGDFDTVWSGCGNADSNIFPPYLSKGDY